MKKLKIVWKRFLLWIGAAAVALPLAACRQTTDPAILAQKNTEQIIELAVADDTETVDAPSGTPLAEQLDAPERLSEQLTGADSKLTVTIDAPVVVPECDMPIVRVEPAEFTQEQVTNVFQAFCGDTPMFLESDVMTKSEIEQSIAIHRENLNDETLQQADRDLEEQVIAELQKAYLTAPETNERTQTDGTLQTIFQTIGRQLIGHLELNATSEDHALNVTVVNDSDNDETIWNIQYDENGNITSANSMGVSRNAYILLTNSAELTTDGLMLLTNRVQRGDPLPAETQGDFSLTPDEAIDCAESWLQKIGVSDYMAVTDVFLETGIDGNGDSSCYYAVFCTRTVDGCPCAYLHNYFGSEPDGTPGIGDDFTFWGYENMLLEITENGVVLMNWAAPLQLLETVNPSATLKPFSEIKEIADKILPMLYEDKARYESVSSAEVTVDRITLSLQRVTDQDQFDQGLLVPVWNFLGTWSYQSTNGDVDALSGSLLSVNAIDGSVIDVGLGY